ncbi:MAG: cell division protein SepF, partial [Acidimicrobiia bacterium]|nr:cell division protein SepF [Acidimicrobiia bacterium]
RGNPGRSRDGDRNFHRQQSLSENEELLDQIVASPESGPADAAENDHRGDGADVELGTRNGNGDLGDGAYEDGAYETEEIIQGAVVRSIDSARSRPRTLNPESFSDAKHVGDEFKRGTPIVINLQGLERDLARRLVDFASGICYALDGKMEKLAPQVFLLTPDGVDVSETDRRRIEERGYAR